MNKWKDDTCSLAFAPTKFDEIFSGYQPRQVSVPSLSSSLSLMMMMMMMMMVTEMVL
jgi:hypothetical protein